MSANSSPRSRSLLALALYLALQSALGVGLSAALRELPGRTIYLPLLGSGLLVWSAGQRMRARRAALGSATAVLVLASLAAGVWTGRALPQGSAVGFRLPPLEFGWALVAGLLGGGGAWMTVRRGHIWALVLGEAFLLTAMGAAAEGGLLTLALFLGVSVLFILGEEHIRREVQWEARGADYATDLRLDTALATLGVSLLLTAAALTLSLPAPRAAWRALAPLTEPLREHIQRLNRAAGLHPAAAGRSAAGETTFAPPPALPREHLLGSGPELAEIPVASIRLQIPLAPAPLPLYWRSGVYDRYTGQGWMWSGGRESRWHNPTRLPVKGELVWQEVTYLGGAPPFPVLALGDVRYLDAGAQSFEYPPDAPFRLNLREHAFQVWSIPSTASPAELRSAPPEYPAWMQERYLALPDDLPSRVRTLALALTRQAETPYDKALALEAYLRRFPYALDLPQPPTDRDLTSYFLFELRRGYCDYYATAFAVLGRAAGLPTRLATGYLGGACDPSTRTCTLYESDAHSWPEVYFPGYGWVVFEPTAGRPALSHAEMEAELPPVPAPRAARRLSLPRGVGGILLSAVGLASALALLWHLAETLSLLRLPPRRRIFRLWEQASRWAERGTEPLPQGATPLEVGNHLKGSFAPLGRLPKGDALLKDAFHCTDSFIHMVNLAWFAAHSPQETRTALSCWRKLRFYLLVAKIRR